MPKVSVIIPVYNVEKYLRQCLNSVVYQTLEDIEIICINDGSTDGSLAILKEYAEKDKRIRIIDQANGGMGPGRARNVGLKIASAPYIFFLDSDDWLDLSCFETLHDKIVSTGSDLCIYGANIYDNQSGKSNSNDTSRYQNRSKEVCTYKEIKSSVFVRFAPWFKLYRTSFIKKNNLSFPKDLFFEDVLFHNKALLLADKICFVDENLYYYRQNREGSEMSLAKENSKVFDIIISLKQTLSFLQSKNLYDELKYEYLEFMLGQAKYHLFRTEKTLNLELKKKIKEFIDENGLLKELNQFKNLQKIYQNTFRPKVSIIIPVYNAEKYLRQCLDSVVNQTLKDIEIICVDDKSTDGSLAILKEYAQKDERIILIEHDHNQRQSLARRHAMEVARGEYIQNVDSDDWIREDACELLYSYAKENNLDMLSFGGINFNQDKEGFEDRGWYSFRWLPENFKKIFTYKDCRKFITNIPLAGCLLFFRRNFLKKNGILWMPKRMVYEDTLFTTEALLKAQRISVLAECLYFRRWHEKSTMNNTDIHFADWFVIVKMLLNMVDNIDSSLIPSYIDFLLKRARSHYLDLSFKSKRKYLEAMLELYQYCIDRYQIELPEEDRKILKQFFWLAPWNIIKLLMKGYFSYKIYLPIVSLEKKKNEDIFKISFKIFGIPVFLFKKQLQKETKVGFFGIPVLKVKEKGIFRRIYLFSLFRIWKQNLFKKIEIPENERLILCFDCLTDKYAEAIDTWTFFQWLQKKNIPSRYIVFKSNALVAKLQKQNHSFKDIIVLDSLNHLLTTCHDDICKSQIILTSFGCDHLNPILKKIPYLKYIYVCHGVMLLKETARTLCSESRYDNILIPTKVTEKMYKTKQLWEGKRLNAGLPRWDKLERVTRPVKNIFIFFTWRKNVQRNLFLLQNYKKKVFSLLTNPNLAQILKKNQINLNIAMHHALIRNNVNIEIPGNVHLVLPTEISKIIGKTDLFITDYSSLVFDFMYLDIPMIFYRFDANFPYLNEQNKADAETAKSHDSELYNVFYNEDEVIRKIEYYVTHNFELEPENLKKNKDIFWDIKDNCEALYNQITKKED